MKKKTVARKGKNISPKQEQTVGVKGDLEKTREEVKDLHQDIISNNRKFIALLLGLLILFGFILFIVPKITAPLSENNIWSYEDAYTQVLEGKETANQYAYNNFVFARETQTDLWTSYAYTADGTQYRVQTYYAPKDLENISIMNDTYIGIYNAQAVVFALNNSLENYTGGGAKAAIGAIEIGKIVGTKYGILNKPTFSALTDGPKSISCANATSITVVIQFNIGDQTSVTHEKNCINVVGETPDDIIKASSRLMYQIIGVMRD